ncbi:MAG: MBL fold metallo-hydrolase [Parcubacteria group bacterium]|nr:MBL fold metallo-hydrolase [Parcubacteria group bacterium]
MLYLNKKIILGVLIFLTVLIFWFVLEKENQKAAVIFLDVGQGDSQLILLLGDVQILIDAGPSANISAKLSQHLPFYDKDIELAILTHPHADHLRGFISIFKDYNVKSFMFSGANYESRVYADFMLALKSEGSKVYLARSGNAVSYQEIPILKILAPLRETWAKNFKEIHESDIVSQLNLADKKFLLMGDAEEELESALVTSNAITDVDVLKVGHHGSKTSTSENLLKIAKPEEAIIQVGRNSYGHPTPLVLDRLTQFGVKVFRNDQVGDVIYK